MAKQCNTPSLKHHVGLPLFRSGRVRMSQKNELCTAKTEKLRNRRGMFSTCHEMSPIHIQFISNSITLRQSLIYNQDHSSSAFRDFLNHGPQALLKRCTAKMAYGPYGLIKAPKATSGKLLEILKVTPIARAGQKKSQVQLNDLDDTTIPRYDSRRLSTAQLESH